MNSIAISVQLAVRSRPPNTADKLRSARPSSALHDAHPTAERTERHPTPPHSPRFVSCIRLLGRPHILGGLTQSTTPLSPIVTAFAAPTAATL